MKRTKTKRIPDIIFCSDFHLQEKKPICRTDDFWSAQWSKMDEISNLQAKYNCMVVSAGDLFDHWKPSPFLLRQTILHLPDYFYTIYGQHDLPQHNLDLVNKCGINVLQAAGKLKVLTGCHWGQDPKNLELGCSHYITSDGIHMLLNGKRNILVWHHLTYITKPFPGATGGQAREILKKYPQYDLIVTGDNHQSFVEEYKGRLLINPGSMMRIDADQSDHRPCVYLWYAKDNTFDIHYLTIKENVISREHIEVKKKRDARLNSFISKLTGDWESSMNFVRNLQNFEKLNKVDPEVIKIVYKSIETKKNEKNKI